MNKKIAGQYFEASEWALARKAARQALITTPDEPALLLILAISCVQLGLDEEALPAYTQLLGLEPEVAAHWANMGTVLRALGHLQDAEDAYQQAQVQGHDDVAFRFNRGLLQLDMNAPQKACEHFAAAYQAAPEEAEVACFYAESLYTLLRIEPALQVARQWRQWQDLSTPLLPRLSNLLLQLGDTAEGEAVLNLALLLEPDDEETLTNLVGVLERSNRLAEAEKYWLRLQKIPVKDDAAQSLRHLIAARLAQRREDHPAAIDFYQAAERTQPGATATADALFSLARTHDAMAGYEACMETLAYAHAVQLKDIASIRPKAIEETSPFNIADFSADANDIARWPAWPQQADVPASPLFVVAFPRSGTTLLEQMLDAHPQLCAMDEQPFLQQVIEAMQQRGAQYPDALSQLNHSQHREIRQDYFSRVASRVQLKPGQRLVDKNPLNLLRLPAIRWLFPDAPVVLVVRHPCDVLLSCYMQQFRAPEFAVMCRSLVSLAEGYVKAFDFFYRQQALLNSKLLELRYESLVEDVEGHTRQLCVLAGLEWNPVMLDPAAHARAKGYISTPSYTQVVKPVNRRAVNRWQRYERHFQPVMPLLQPYLQRWGYPGF
jgi:Flp pilus assembly protein TadD